MASTPSLGLVAMNQCTRRFFNNLYSQPENMVTAHHILHSTTKLCQKSRPLQRGRLLFAFDKPDLRSELAARALFLDLSGFTGTIQAPTLTSILSRVLVLV